MEFKESQTFRNLLIAYEDKLNTSTKYSIFDDISRNEGYIEVANIYRVTAQNDKEHARIWLRTLNEGLLPNTKDILLESIQTEHNVSNNLYQEFSRVAREEGFEEIASLFSGIANIDYYHESRFQVLYENIVNETMYCNLEETLWICMQCGNIMYGTCAPEICPVCFFPQGYYRLFEQTVDF